MKNSMLQYKIYEYLLKQLYEKNMLTQEEQKLKDSCKEDEEFVHISSLAIGDEIRTDIGYFKGYPDQNICNNINKDAKYIKLTEIKMDGEYRQLYREGGYYIGHSSSIPKYWVRKVEFNWRIVNKDEELVVIKDCKIGDELRFWFDGKLAINWPTDSYGHRYAKLTNSSKIGMCEMGLGDKKKDVFAFYHDEIVIRKKSIIKEDTVLKDNEEYVNIEDVKIGDEVRTVTNWPANRMFVVPVVTYIKVTKIAFWLNSKDYCNLYANLDGKKDLSCIGEKIGEKVVRLNNMITLAKQLGIELTKDVTTVTKVNKTKEELKLEIAAKIEGM